ncbi:hypothetical protein Y032_0534g3071 [Ancylostoma ceylanicum]|uniref:Uncharacterized protein n=1 Tax=Ancylostoma ceylanicum TaxID=53326 RepID=A0A016WRT0_9BILA|nr:hypothetical protein Y032_0534g3071 [Ancylostoma ceylanicum]
MEMKILLWMAGITRLDCIRNKFVLQRFGYPAITNKLREARLLWYVHVLRTGNDSVSKIGIGHDIADQ